jgi:MFS family permease
MLDETRTAATPYNSTLLADNSLGTDEKTDLAVASPPIAPQSHQNQPNGGLTAWLQVAAGWSIFFNTWGVMNTFGVFQTYYEFGLLFTESSSNIAWIGSIQALCLVTLGLVSGPLYDRGYFRALVIIGSFLIVFSFMMLSIAKTFWEVLLAQGFCCGIGAGLIFVPGLAVIPTYFNTRLGLAVGVAASGSSFGGVIYPIVFHSLLPSIGFAWTVRTIGFIALGTLVVPVCFMKMRVKPAKPRAFLDWSAIGLYVTMFFISFFAEATGSTNASLAFYLIPIVNAGSVFGRTIPNAISDYTGPLSCEYNLQFKLGNLLTWNTVFGPAGVLCGALTLCLIVATNLGGVVTVSLLYGFFSGVYVALPPVCFVRLTADKSKVGTRIGMGFAFTSVAVLTGGPGGGGVLGTNVPDLHWRSLWIYGGVCSIIGGVMLLALRIYLTKGKLYMKM